MPLLAPETRRKLLLALVQALLIAFGGVAAVSAPRLGCQPPPPPTPPTKPDPEPPPSPGKLDPWEAIGRLTSDSSFCSGTVIGPPLRDGRWRIVSAAHCVKRRAGGHLPVGTRLSFQPRNGGAFPVIIQGIDPRSDCMIVVSEHPHPGLPYTLVAETNPQPGEKVFHGGFGQHIPGNREEGVVVGGPNDAGQVRYKLSVSPGDSGGGICLNKDGKLLSPTCCTTCLGCWGDVWGAGPEAIRKMLTDPTSFLELPPAEMPPPPVEAAAPVPMPMPAPMPAPGGKS